MQDIELSRIGQGYPSHFTIRRPLAKAIGVCFGSIVLQKSKVAGPRFFGENTKREAITDSYNLNRIAEVAGEFNVRR
jgi:hypothetical protein